MKDVNKLVSEFLKENPVEKQDLERFAMQTKQEMLSLLTSFWSRAAIKKRVEELIKEFPDEVAKVEKEIENEIAKSG